MALKRRLRPAILAAALLLPGLAAAQEGAPRIPRSVLPGLGGADPRRPVDRTAAPWRGLGRVQLDLGLRCTGTLIGPRLVLTAAHCLIAPRAQAMVQPKTVHFLLGYDRGNYLAHGQVTAYRTGPGFDPVRGGPAPDDWAVLTLDLPLGTPDRVLPLLQAVPQPRTPLMLGGYQQDRPEVVLADTACRVLGLSAAGPAGMLMHDCAGTRGVSGAPVLAALPDGGWAVAGVASRVAVDLALGSAVRSSAIAATLQ